MGGRSDGCTPSSWTARACGPSATPTRGSATSSCSGSRAWRRAGCRPPGCNCLTCTVMSTLAEARADRPWTESPPWRVTARRAESHDTVTLELEPPEPFGFEPGQFNMLRVPGIGEVPISISGDPTRAGPVLHTIRDVGAVTHALCALSPGQAVGVRGPYGTSWPVRAAEGGDVVIVAGG